MNCGEKNPLEEDRDKVVSVNISPSLHTATVYSHIAAGQTVNGCKNRY